MRQRIEADNVWLAGEAEESKLELAERDNRVESELTKALEEGVVVEASCATPAAAVGGAGRWR